MFTLSLGLAAPPVHIQDPSNPLTLCRERRGLRRARIGRHAIHAIDVSVTG